MLVGFVELSVFGIATKHKHRKLNKAANANKKKYQPPASFTMVLLYLTQQHGRMLVAYRRCLRSLTYVTRLKIGVDNSELYLYHGRRGNMTVNIHTFADA